MNPWEAVDNKFRSSGIVEFLGKFDPEKTKMFAYIRGREIIIGTVG